MYDFLLGESPRQEAHMPTFGTPETATHNPPELRVMHIQRSIGVLDARRAKLVAEWSDAVSDCEHHFVPASGPLENIPATDSGVRYAGELTGQGGQSTFSFELRCTRCPTTVETSLAEHCPVCAHELAGGWIPLLRPGPYPGSCESARAWLASCPPCDFVSVACVPRGIGI